MHATRDGNNERVIYSTKKRKSPFGVPGEDHSKSYPVSVRPLYATDPNPLREMIERMAVALSGTIGVEHILGGPTKRLIEEAREMLK